MDITIESAASPPFNDRCDHRIIPRDCHEWSLVDEWQRGKVSGVQRLGFLRIAGVDGLVTKTHQSAESVL
jgi:hypothetical protein